MAKVTEKEITSGVARCIVSPQELRAELAGFVTRSEYQYQIVEYPAHKKAAAYQKARLYLDPDDPEYAECELNAFHAYFETAAEKEEKE